VLRRIQEHAAAAGHERRARRLRPDEPAVARAEPVVALAQPAGEQLLDRARRRDDDRQGVRVHGGHVAREIDDPEQPAGVGVGDGRRRARPALDGLGEVLGGEDLDGVLGGERGADRVRPGAGLAPQGALDEVHVVGGAIAQPSVAADAEQHPVGVADHGQVVGLHGRERHALLDERACDGEGVVLPQAARAVELDERGGGLTAGGIHARVAGSEPGVGDRVADLRRPGVLVVQWAAVDEAFPRVAQLACPFRRDRRGVDRYPGVV
jgi:hypothetical protein